jgi:hypothetical protein
MGRSASFIGPGGVGCNLSDPQPSAERRLMHRAEEAQWRSRPDGSHRETWLPCVR